MVKTKIDTDIPGPDLRREGQSGHLSKGLHNLGPLQPVAIALWLNI